MVRSMQVGSIIVDLAVETGGNCALSRNHEVIVAGNTTIIGMGSSHMAAGIFWDSNLLFARNVFNFVSLMIKDGKIDTSDEIIAATIVK
jgi:NAD(P) transhydrogenase subunit alpha